MARLTGLTARGLGKMISFAQRGMTDPRVRARVGSHEEDTCVEWNTDCECVGVVSREFEVENVKKLNISKAEDICL